MAHVQGAGRVRGVGLGVGVQRLAGAQDARVVSAHALFLRAFPDLAHAVSDDMVLDPIDQFPAGKKSMVVGVGRVGGGGEGGRGEVGKVRGRIMIKYSAFYVCSCSCIIILCVILLVSFMQP